MENDTSERISRFSGSRQKARQISYPINKITLKRDKEKVKETECDSGTIFYLGKKKKIKTIKQNKPFLKATDLKK